MSFININRLSDMSFLKYPNFSGTLMPIGNKLLLLEIFHRLILLPRAGPRQ